jgi:Rubisco LSMT substrate-binding
LAPSYTQKVALFESARLKVTATFPLTLTDPLPLDVLRYLRIQRLSSSEISAMEARLGAKNMVSARNETEILRALIEACNSLLNGFGIPLENLETNIASGLYQKGDNKWAAAHVSFGEQNVLKMTLQKTRSLLALVICAQCGSQNESNKRCSKCNTMWE